MSKLINIKNFITGKWILSIETQFTFNKIKLDKDQFASFDDIHIMKIWNIPNGECKETNALGHLLSGEAKPCNINS